MNDSHPCPCGMGVPFFHCCRPFLEGSTAPATAEQLVRSRYTAYVLGHEDYLLRTWHPSTRPREVALLSGSAARWIGLKILRAEAGGPGDRNGVVEFVARCKINGRATRMHEISRFVREGGYWMYVAGEAG